MTSWNVEGLTSRLARFDLGPVDLELPPGRVVAVLGPSGAGKTTFLRTLAGFVPARTGRLTRGGVDVTDERPERRGLGYVPQGLGLLPHKTVEANVGYALEIRGRRDWRARAREMLDRFGLGPLAKRYPARLSGGEAQRVALARTLVAEPELVLWDEPWQALDVEARQTLGVVLEDLREEARAPIVLVTHDPGLAFSIADSFLVLRSGHVASHGDALGLIEHPRDEFSARFAGFENVYDSAVLARAPPGSLGAWLAVRAGPGGLAFARPVLPASGRSEGPWTGTVRSSHPTPEGVALTLESDGLRLAARIPPPLVPPFPASGERLRFSVEEKSLRPLGESP